MFQVGPILTIVYRVRELYKQQACHCNKESCSKQKLEHKGWIEKPQ
jgi:hypothetical protein